MMAYNKIEVCVITLFLHSLLLTPGISQSQNETLTESTTKSSVLEETTELIQPKSSSPAAVPEYKSTVEACIQPNLTADAISFQKAMEGYGTDVFTIVYLIAMRSNKQRQDIRNIYSQIYKKNLIAELESELSGNLRTTVVSLMLTNDEFYAKELHDAIDGLGTDNEALSEILGSLSSAEIKEIAAVYARNYGSKLKDDISADTSGSFRKLLEQLCDAKRESDSVDVNTAKVEEDTRALILAGFSSRLRNTNAEEEALISIFTSRSFPMLKLISDKYYELKNKNISESIVERYSSSLEYALTTIIQRASSKNNFYASLLNDAMYGIGTNNRQLIRIIVGRSEKDLDEIKNAYQETFKSSLIDQVSDETSGEYRNLLMAILRK